MKTKNLLLNLILTTLALSLFSCASIPKGATAVEPFDLERYLGNWYEIARLDFKYERDLNNTTANYSLNENGTVKVLNQGYNTVKKEWTEAVGKAKFRKEKDIAKLKVSFFGPFYSGYNVIALDEQYQYALVAGKNLKFLWILSRQTTIPDAIKAEYLKIAEEIGYNTADLIWVTQDKK